MLLAAFTVSNTNDSGPGSLRQAILDANSTVGADTVQFNIPTSDPGFNLAGNPIGSQWWTIRLESPLPMLTDSGTQILGFTQKTNVADLNAGLVGTGGTVGVDAVPLPQYERPEIAIDGNDFDALAIDPAASNILIEGLAIYNAGNAVSVPALNPPISGTARVVRSMLIGTLPDGTDPGPAQRNNLNGIVILDGAAQLTVQRSYVGYNAQGGIVGGPSASRLLAEFNEVFGNGWNSDIHSGIEVSGIGSSVRFNLSRDNVNDLPLSAPDAGSGHGIMLGARSVGSGSNGNNLIFDNTIHENASAGIAVRKGSNNNLIQNNIITANEVGVSVNTEDGTATTGNTITANRIFLNRGLGIDLHTTASTIPAFDGLTLNDPFDTDTGANDLVNFPIITDARITGGTLTIEGFVSAGATVEFYFADVDPSGFGEGRTSIGRFTEGTAQDGDTAIGTYGPTVNGIAVATGVVVGSRFRFALPIPSGLTEDSVLTSAAIVNSSSSEFGLNRAVRGVGSISGAVYSDANDNGVKDVGELGIAGVTITLHGNDAHGNPVHATRITGSDGSYSFSDLPPGTYEISETQPSLYLDGDETIGTLGGLRANDHFTGIVVAEGAIGTDYNFGEIAPSRLAGSVFLDLNDDGQQNGSDSPIPGVKLTLTGTNDRGQNVNLTTMTAANGSYSFQNLRPGVYSIRETQPAGFADGKDSIGTQGGRVNPDEFQSLLAQPGVDGTDNNFAELTQLAPSCVLYTSIIYPNTTQQLEVRVLKKSGCDPKQLDVSSVQFGGAPLTSYRTGRKGQLSLYFSALQTTLVPADDEGPGDTIARFTGQLVDGTVFSVDLPVVVLKISTVVKFRRRH